MRMDFFDPGLIPFYVMGATVAAIWAAQLIIPWATGQIAAKRQIDTTNLMIEKISPEFNKLESRFQQLGDGLANHERVFLSSIQNTREEFLSRLATEQQSIAILRERTAALQRADDRLEEKLDNIEKKIDSISARIK